MNNILYWILIVLICAFALVSAYVSFILILLSGIFVDEIGYDNIQRQGADSKALLISLCGVLSFISSISVALLSSRIAGVLFRLLRIKFARY